MMNIAEMYAKALNDVIKTFEKRLKEGKDIDYQLATIRDLKIKFDRITRYRQDLKEQLKVEYLNRKIKEVEKAANYKKVDESIKNFTTIDQREVNSFFKVFNDRLNIAENGIARQVRKWFDEEQAAKTSELNKLVRNEVTERAMNGISKKQAIQNIVKGLRNNLYCKLVDKNGNPLRFSLPAYANLNVNSMFQQARNTASIKTNKALGNPLVKFSKHYWTCVTCAKYCEGRVYSTSRKDKRYPYLFDIPGFKDGYNLIHPNCKHLLSGFYPQGYTKKELDKINKLSQSNNDVRSDAMVEKYDTSQDINYYIRQQNFYKEQLEYLKGLEQTSEVEAQTGNIKDKLSVIKKRLSSLRQDFKEL